jgi:hypothetical protein
VDTALHRGVAHAGGCCHLYSRRSCTYSCVLQHCHSAGVCFGLVLQQCHSACLFRHAFVSAPRGELLRVAHAVGLLPGVSRVSLCAWPKCSRNHTARVCARAARGGLRVAHAVGLFPRCCPVCPSMPGLGVQAITRTYAITQHLSLDTAGRRRLCMCMRMRMRTRVGGACHSV